MPSWRNATSLPPDLPRPPTGGAGGVLHPADLEPVVHLERLAPPPSLSRWVEHLWSVTWSLPPGRSHTSRILTHPAVHLTVEWGPGTRYGVAMPAALVHGVVTRVFSVELVGTGGVTGVRFRPGGFAAFTGEGAEGWTDRVAPLTVLHGDAALGLTRSVAGEPDLHERARAWWGFLLDRRPVADDPAYDEVLRIVTLVLDDRSVTSVGAMAAAAGVSVRTLQRLFRQHVGVGPKWVLQRFRLQDAVAMIDAGEVDDLATLATALGWYDQAHFGRDFAQVVGISPGRYLATSAGAPA